MFQFAKHRILLVGLGVLALAGAGIDESRRVLPTCRSIGSVIPTSRPPVPWPNAHHTWPGLPRQRPGLGETMTVSQGKADDRRCGAGPAPGRVAACCPRRCHVRSMSRGAR